MVFSLWNENFTVVCTNALAGSVVPANVGTVKETEPINPALQEATERFIEAWGTLASAWGVSKTMAQVYALLYASHEPLDTDHVMQALGISRGNANINLRKLVEWQLVRKVNLPEQPTRKEHFEAEKDVWNLTSRVVRERAEKEIAPVPAVLQEVVTDLEANTAGALSREAEEFKRNVEAMASFLRLFNTLMERILPLLENRNQKQIEQLIKLLPSPKRKPKPEPV